MTAPILHHPAFKASLINQALAPAKPQPGLLAKLTGWLHEKTLAFEHVQACRRTARIVRALPNDVQKDIGWRAHCTPSHSASEGPAYVASLAPKVFFNQS